MLVVEDGVGSLASSAALKGLGSESGMSRSDEEAEAVKEGTVLAFMAAAAALAAAIS